ncbi:MAG: DUF1963 domain-containing protein, partial [Pseudomonadota bacterium]
STILRCLCCGAGPGRRPRGCRPPVGSAADRTAALVPEGERARLAAEYRSPAQAHHRMLGQPVQIQNEFYGHHDKMLLLQLHYDALMCFYFGDVGQVSFLIAPEDLAEGRFDRVAMTTACH